MIEKHGSTVRSDRFFRFGSPLRGDGNAVWGPATASVQGTLSMGSGAGPAEKVDERHAPPLTLRAGAPFRPRLAPGEMP